MDLGEWTTHMTTYTIHARWSLVSGVYTFLVTVLLINILYIYLEVKSSQWWWPNSFMDLGEWTTPMTTYTIHASWS